MEDYGPGSSEYRRASCNLTQDMKPRPGAVLQISLLLTAISFSFLLSAHLLWHQMLLLTAD